MDIAGGEKFDVIVVGAGNAATCAALSAREAGTEVLLLEIAPEEARGGNSFGEFSLPEAILKFRQGVGRLIRTRTDTGIIVVLDNRVLTKQYGQAFLDALPKCPVEIV